MSVIEYFVVDRSIACFGIPSNSVSIIRVTCDSISTEVIPGAFKTIFTCVGDISGKASIGILSQALAPIIMVITASILTNNRWVNENLMMEVSINYSPEPSSSKMPCTALTDEINTDFSVRFTWLVNK